jgi:hypothetical protein
MGMDLIGHEPITTHGEYFRASIWRWPTLWKFVCDSCGDILTEEDKESGNYNGGHFITKPKAMQIGTKLWSMLRTGVVAAYAEATPPVLSKIAAFHEELHKRLAEQGNGQFGSCRGTIIMTPGGIPVLQLREAKPDPLDPHVVAEFADFCVESGGFEIW